MTTIAAKPTLYAGTRFRSRLEARWAVFFDAIGREWVYEPNLPELAPLQYQPDFLTSRPDSGLTLIEVKPSLDAAATVAHLNDDRWSRVANLSGCDFVVLFGTPGEWLEGRLSDMGHFGALWRPSIEVVNMVQFAECDTCGSVSLWPDGVSRCHQVLPSGPLLTAYHAVRDHSYEDA